MRRLELALPADHAAALRALLRTCAHLRAEVARELDTGEGRAAGRVDAARRAGSVCTLVLLLGKYFGQASREELGGAEA